MIKMCNGKWVEVRKRDDRNRNVIIGYKCLKCKQIKKKISYCKLCHNTIRFGKWYCDGCSKEAKNINQRQQRAIHSPKITFIDRMPMNDNMDKLLSIMIDTYQNGNIKV